MTYRIEVRPAALRQLRKIDPTQQARIRGAIALLAEDPRPPAAMPLRGRPAWHVRVGDYRIIYTINDDVLLIVIVTLGHRREVYAERDPARPSAQPPAARRFVQRSPTPRRT